MTTRRLFSKTATRSALCKVRAGRLVAGQNLLFFIILPLSCDIVGALYSLIIIGHYPTEIWQTEIRTGCVDLTVASIPCQLLYDIYWPGSREKSLCTCISPRKWKKFTAGFRKLRRGKYQLSLWIIYRRLALESKPKGIDLHTDRIPTLYPRLSLRLRSS